MKESLINKKYKNLNKNSKIYSILVMKNQEKIIFKIINGFLNQMKKLRNLLYGD